MDSKSFFKNYVTLTASVHRVTHKLAKDCKSDIVTPIQYSILEHLAVSDPKTLSEISECHHMSLPNTSRELKKLSEKNLIVKTNDKSDRRKQYICLSEEGKDLMNEAFQCIESHFANRINHLSEDELLEVNNAIDLLHKKLFY